MITSKIKIDELNDFYQSKFEYFKTVSGYSAFLIGLLEISYFITDCQLFGRFAYETLIPRFAILIPLLFFWFLYPKIQTYQFGIPLYYLIPHAAMWCTIWAIWYLPNRDFAREGFIIMHFAFLAIGLAMPLKYHVMLHGCMILNIIISNFWIHYETFSLMITLALPVYIGVIAMLYILESSYADQYLIKKELEICSFSDELTGAYNRHQIEKLIDKDTERFTFEKNSVVLMIDIDFFKKVNDNFGHDIGDNILKFVAEKIKSQIYGRDYLIRWGGEEFVVILVDYTKDQAIALAEKLRQDIENSDNEVCPLTVTIGLCRYNKNETFHNVINKADKALYYGKEHGRNQVVNFENI